MRNYRLWPPGLPAALSTIRKAPVRLINRSKGDSIGGPACAAALKCHVEKFGEHGRRYTQTIYTVRVRGQKVTVEIVSRSRSYVATALTGARHLRRLPGLADS
ncbi:DUF4060 family protein [Enterobacter ludwigii]|uniref:DUF4060 family protein n=1 Tax=Enterobacter ludwigii TaxID=299767 RepID=UPI002F3F7D7F